MVRDLRTPRRRILAVVGIVCLFALSGFPTLGIAGDQFTVFQPEERTVETQSGETIDIVVEMQSDGGHEDVGVESVELVARYHPEYFSVTDVEAGPWLHQGSDTAVESDVDIDEERGTVTVEQWRDPPDGGAEGRDVYVTLTMLVDDDTPAADATIAFEESTSEVRLTNDWPQSVLAMNQTVAINGGGDEIDPDEYNYENESLENGETSDADADEELGDDADSADSTAGFTVAITLCFAAVVLLAAASLSFHRR